MRPSVIAGRGRKKETAPWGMLGEVHGLSQKKSRAINGRSKNSHFDSIEAAGNREAQKAPDPMGTVLGGRKLGENFKVKGPDGPPQGDGDVYHV